MRIKSLPNTITFIRIICATEIIFTKPFSLLFWILYISCGISDILDGYIARSMKLESEMGAKLDSIGDILFGIALIVVLIPVLEIPVWLWIGILAIAFIRILSYIIGYIKYHTFSSLHTYANKLTGLFIFTSPILYAMFGINITGIILCVIATISALEELIITIKSKELYRDCKSIFKRFE